MKQFATPVAYIIEDDNTVNLNLIITEANDSDEAIEKTKQSIIDRESENFEYGEDIIIPPIWMEGSTTSEEGYQIGEPVHIGNI